MGMFSGPKTTYTELAAELPPTQSTWIVTLGSVGLNASKAALKIDEAVAEIEAGGWRLEQLTPATRGTFSGGGGSSECDMLGVFRRV